MSEEYNSTALNARELEWANNPPETLAAHKARNGPICRTRFPPEPNGYLHIGHAKSMNMNFSLAFQKLNVPPEHRRTIFRYDDTNPDAETAEYIDSLKRDLEWLGWKPERTTYSSDNFGKLYEFAVELVKKELAYVCDMTKAEMEAQRELAMKRANARARGLDPDVEAPITDPNILPGRNRNTSVERNLELLEKMKMGLFAEGQYTLRLKMDFESSNPNMYDLVAYRIKYTPHPHAGDGWCIYPSYDFTHGICDSLEDIDYSICTLEFETRREPYYWILHALDLFRPAVYEMSRLNLQYTVLSKRRLIKLVDTGVVRGWDDPRMPTVSGLRRRGYTPVILNTFCDDIGATRSANVVEIKKLEQTARLALAATSRRAMAALDPIKVVITNYSEQSENMVYEVQNSPTDPEAGVHTVTLTDVIYLDSTDFRMEDSKDYFGLAPNKAVGLKYYGGNLVCEEVIEKNGKIVELKGHLDNGPDRVKPKTYLSWVPSNSLPCEIRVYNHLFTVPEPSDLWEDEINPDSEQVFVNALIDPSVAEVIDVKDIDKWKSNTALQLERFGFFVVDLDTTFDSKTRKGSIVLNRTVSLKEDKGKSGGEKSAPVNDGRKVVSAEEREARMNIAPEDFFRLAPEYNGKFSKFDDEGFPTHDEEGKEVTKSMAKKLKKELDKHKKLVSKKN
ncbi:glutaminyl-tRNA synthetase [Fistulifera solaris]|jgi:glutaminyl-tRNA synthetase|uniref:glutamine--tRNA ligase n=1 Tax=Fistulifera solaris TaxID=1519565 RepID=A0A1Z5JS28_FISSO|nr:glutaminyl-tRNA synthetase [Fistulifera solaris]|eukprot:GAX16830.1 glutaminyl-tRNA synthetase [Fistulifera solaris]